MRPSLVLLAVFGLSLSACVTTGAGGGPNGWGGGTVEEEAPTVAVRTRPTPRRAPQPAARDTRPERASRPERATPAPAPARPEVARGPAGSLVIPVAGVVGSDLRDSFTAGRSGGRTHNAIDIGAPMGTPVVATTDGTVSRMSWNALGGRTLYLTSADGRHDYYYAHLDSYAEGMEVGQTVRRGDVLGAVGQTGNARSPHLHFQVLDRSGGGRTPVNPFDLLRGAEAVAAR